jgi:hypothetical protein
MFLTIFILEKGLEFEMVTLKGTIVLYISWYKSRERGDPWRDQDLFIYLKLMQKFPLSEI